MALTYKASGGEDYKRVPPGSHIGVCDLIADIGVQEGLFGSKRQLYVRFEVPEERVEYERDGKKVEGPIVIGITFTASMHKKANLRKQLESWRGKAFTDEEAEKFDVSSILGKGCMLMVVENQREDKTYSNIASIGKLPKTMTSPKAENEPLFYTDSESEDYDKLPEWLRKKIDTQIIVKPNGKEQNQNGDSYYDQAYRNTEISDDDIPF